LLKSSTGVEGKSTYLSVALGEYRDGTVAGTQTGGTTGWEPMGTVDQPPSSQATFASKQRISGKDGGHTINLHQFARGGEVLLGRIQGVKDGTIMLGRDLKENLG
jgi:hypothetical protein